MRGAEQGGDRRAGREVAVDARQLGGGAQAQRLPEVDRDGGTGQEQGGEPAQGPADHDRRHDAPEEPGRVARAGGGAALQDGVHRGG